MLYGTAANVLKFAGLLATTIDSCTIKRVNMAKYLGIIIDDKMSWKHQRNVGMMKRVRRDDPTKCLIALHRTLVEPYIRYCKMTWVGVIHHYQIPSGLFQNRAARVIANVKYENTDHAKLLKDLDCLNVQELITLDTAFLMYKIENDLAPTHMKEIFVKTSDLHVYSTRSATSGTFHPPSPSHRKLNIGKAFSCWGAHVWNQLSVEIREAQSLENFHNSLKTSIKKRF